MARKNGKRKSGRAAKAAHHDQAHHPGSSRESARERELSTIRSINEAVDAKDFKQLRGLSSACGLVHHSVRERCWALLSGADAHMPPCTQQEYEAWAEVQHRDRHVVRVDVERSLHNLLEGCSEEELRAKRQQLQRLLNAVVGRYCTLEPPSSSASSSPPTPSHPNTSPSTSAAPAHPAPHRSGHPRTTTASHPSSPQVSPTPSTSSAIQRPSNDPAAAAAPQHPPPQQQPKARRRTGGILCLGGGGSRPATLSPQGSLDDPMIGPLDVNTPPVAAAGAAGAGVAPRTSRGSGGGLGCLGGAGGGGGSRSGSGAGAAGPPSSSGSSSARPSSSGGGKRGGALLPGGATSGGGSRPGSDGWAQQPQQQPEVEVQPEATSLAAELHPATTASAARQEPRRHQLPPQPSSTKPADPPWPGPGDAAPPDSPDSPLPRPPPHPHVRNSAFALPASNAPAPDDAHDATAPSSLPAPNHQTSTSTPASPRHANGVYAAAHPGGGADAAPPAGPRVQSQEVFYYQGLHDVASVLLLVLGSERAAFPVLCRLVRCQLRDATRISLAPIMEVLGLLYPLLSHVDPDLSRHLQAHSLPPFFALSWLITWFSHDLTNVQASARLFDLFLSAHPLMPLYVGVAAMRGVRQQLLDTTEMPELHTLLAKLQVTQYTGGGGAAAAAAAHGHAASIPPSPRGGGAGATAAASSPLPSARSLSASSRRSSLSAPHGAPGGNGGTAAHGPLAALNDLVAAALELYHEWPPLKVVKLNKLLLANSVVPCAQLAAERWSVPDVPPDAGKMRGAASRDKSGGGGAVMRFWRQVVSRGKVDPRGGSGGVAAGAERRAEPPPQTRTGRIMTAVMTTAVTVYLVVSLATRFNGAGDAAQAQAAL